MGGLGRNMIICTRRYLLSTCNYGRWCGWGALRDLVHWVRIAGWSLKDLYIRMKRMVRSKLKTGRTYPDVQEDILYQSGGVGLAKFAWKSTAPDTVCVRGFKPRMLDVCEYFGTPELMNASRCITDLLHSCERAAGSGNGPIMPFQKCYRPGTKTPQ